MSATLVTQEVLRAAADERVRRALAHIQRAQDELGAAQSELAGLRNGAPIWSATGKLYDRVHAFWYRVDAFRERGKFALDPACVEALTRRIEEVA